MTPDQIIQMLRKVVAENQGYTTWTVSTPHLVALVHHAIAEEREACAKVADGWPDYDVEGLAEAIRARGQA